MKITTLKFVDRVLVPLIANVEMTKDVFFEGYPQYGTEEYDTTTDTELTEIEPGQYFVKFTVYQKVEFILNGTETEKV